MSAVTSIKSIIRLFNGRTKETTVTPHPGAAPRHHTASAIARAGQLERCERDTAVFIGTLYRQPIEWARVVSRAGRIVVVQFKPLGIPDPYVALPAVPYTPRSLALAGQLIDTAVSYADESRVSRGFLAHWYDRGARQLPLFLHEVRAILDDGEWSILRLWWLHFLAQPQNPITNLEELL
ncbi:MAG: hypothetical protein D6706_16665 [Chloroflexi bacterium]|nr:MAG: hypothetical protein D6706_16665 [Chloroflexota bacterium]